MSEQDRPRTLPMRRWLALALLVTFLIPACVIIIFAVASVRENPHDDKEQAADRLRDDAERWQDPAWQEMMRADLAKDNVTFILFEGDREIYRSAADPFAGDDGDRSEREVELVVIADSDPELIGYVYADEDDGPPDNVPVQFIPIVGLTTLGLTLTGIAWFLGRTILRPLAATSQAARQVASGDLDVALPRSRVREVDEVNIAFDAMSAALRTSLEEQAELEQERRLFIGAVAHDLRTPLFALRGYLEGIESGVASTPEQRARYVSVAREKANDLERLISDLFAYSRLEYLEQSPQREPLDLTELLRRLADEMQPLAAAKGVTIVNRRGRAMLYQRRQPSAHARDREPARQRRALHAGWRRRLDLLPELRIGRDLRNRGLRPRYRRFRSGEHLRPALPRRKLAQPAYRRCRARPDDRPPHPARPRRRPDSRQPHRRWSSLHRNTPKRLTPASAVDCWHGLTTSGLGGGRK